MSSLSLDAGARAGAPTARRRLARAIPRPRPELAALLLLAGLLHLWALSRNGYANEYYAAAVRSMSSSWHAFLYGSFDGAGLMTVDKPPLALWVQALSVKLLGFHALSLLVPQALMGVASVALVCDLVRRRFGRAGGFVAGLVLALTPISVAISRHNNPDALLVLCSAAALWCVVRALEDGRTRWLVGAGVAVGLGFETKMGAALLVVPALAAAYLWSAPRGRLVALRQLAGGGAAMVVVGGAWPLLVALTPAADRPWVSGTSDDSVWSLITGYNGLGRLEGQAGGPGGGGPGGVFGGDTGPLRLLDASLGGQAGWLLGFAVVAIVAVALASRMRRADVRSGWVIAVGGSFATIAVAFSAAQGIFHPYYVSLLAPFTASLVGAGAAQVAERGRVWRVLAPAAVVAGIATELAVLGQLPGQLETVKPMLAVVAVLAATALAAVEERRARRALVGVALAALLVAPATWSVQTLGHATSGTFPAGGPQSAALGSGPGGPRGGFGGGARGPLGAGATPGGGTPGAAAPPAAGAAPGGGTSGAGAPPAAGAAPGGGPPQGGGFAGGPFGGAAAGLTEAIAYAKAHGGGTIAVSSQSTAASAALRTGADVAALGGFSGRESEVSAAWLAQRVAAGDVRWVLTDGSGGVMRDDGRTGSRSVMAAVEASCSPVQGVDGLHDCRDAARALASTG